MIKKFPISIHKELKYYVYIYIDPRNDEIFYVGKGKGDRCFSHLFEDSEKEKVRKIKDIRADGLEPKIEIIVHGIEDDSLVKRIEASIIDCFKIDKLTNIQRGYHSKEFGRMSVQQLIATYQAEDVEVEHPVISFKLNSTFRYGLDPIKLYDFTRHSWKLGPRKDSAQYAFAVYQGIVQEVYKIECWLPQNSTLNSKYIEESEDKEVNEERWEFVGNIASKKIRDKYLYKDVSKYIKSNQNPVAYINT
ncbi:MAG: hypothetical protein OEX81_03400 [Candidatus Pacebacteria bacterium]|nr:hypothetical protein [Candidatus Paceibacterota bacterium]